MSQVTYDPNDQFFPLFVKAHQEGIIHDEVSGQELGVVAESMEQHRLGVGTQVKGALNALCRGDNHTSLRKRHFNVVKKNNT